MANEANDGADREEREAEAKNKLQERGEICDLRVRIRHEIRYKTVWQRDHIGEAEGTPHYMPASLLFQPQHVHYPACDPEGGKSANEAEEQG